MNSPSNLADSDNSPLMVRVSGFPLPATACPPRPLAAWAAAAGRLPEVAADGRRVAATVVLGAAGGALSALVVFLVLMVMAPPRPTRLVSVALLLRRLANRPLDALKGFKLDPSKGCSVKCAFT